MIISTLKYASCVPVKTPYHVHTHMHHNWELVYYKTGIGITTISKNKSYYSPNTYILIPPNVPHSEESISDNNILFCMGFELSGFDYPINDSVLYVDSTKEIDDIVEQLMKETHSTKSFNKEIISLLISEIIYKTLRQDVKDIQSRFDERINMIKEYINNYYNTKLNFENISSNFYYSYDYIRHIFKEKMGISIKQYVLQTRINNAKKLLLECNLSNKEIAKKCGFSSPSHFASCFLEETGQTPSEYKKTASRIDYGADRFAVFLDEHPNW